ncbi:MAG: hypothetical protein J6F32_15635, partial [Pseudomonas sp.]|nr:hypothetical protein [Pseudomonas sp.]
NLQLIQFLEASIQAANKNSGLAITLPVSLLGIANVTTQAKIIEPQQFSAMGDPRLAKTDPLGANRIYVRTAQVRTLISVHINGLQGAAGIVNALREILKKTS